MTPLLRRPIATLLALELPLVLAVSPLLLFPALRPGWTAGATTVLMLFWLARWAVRREPWPVTPFNAALLLFTLTIPVAVWASAFPDLTLPKLTGLLLGLAAFRAVALAVHDRRTLAWGLAALGLVGLGITAVGLLGVGWTSKMPLFASVIARLPRPLVSLPGAPDQGINPNQLAGAMALYLPMAAGVALGGWRERRHGLALLALAAVGVTGLTLLLTQSRTGWIGGAGGLATLGLLWGLTSRRRRVVLAAALLPLLALAAVVAIVITLGPGRLDQLIYGAGTPAGVEQAVGEISLSGRGEIWSRAIYAIQDFPFTGTGLGTFRRVVPLLYPLFTVGPEVDIAHAHNIFLQVAVDLGLGGLVAYLALLWGAAGITWRAARSGSPWVRFVALGLLAGLVGLHIYGLADALALGSKPGLAFWMVLGLIGALPAACEPPLTEPSPPLRSGSSPSRFASRSCTRFMT